MPLLGAFVIAGDRFRDKKSGYRLYNLTSGITSTDLAAWLSRWLDQQDFEVTRSYVNWSIEDKGTKPASYRNWTILAALLSMSLIGLLIAMTVLADDWYGFATAVSLLLGVLARAYILHVNRDEIDRAVDKSYQAGKAGEGPPNTNARTMFLLSDSKAVVMEIPSSLIIDVFVHNRQPTGHFRRRLYHFAHWLAWAAFAVQVIAIGMAQLASQLYTVVLMVVSTILINWKLGCDDSKWGLRWKQYRSGNDELFEKYDCWIGSRLKAEVSQWPSDLEFEKDKGGVWNTIDIDKFNEDKVGSARKSRSKKRQDLFAWLRMTREEESSWAQWDLFPHYRSDGDKTWWQTYLNKKFLAEGRNRVEAAEMAEEEVKHLEETVLKRKASTRNQTLQPGRDIQNAPIAQNGGIT